ncbi:helix-turn-helix transcriptional regulator [Eggerthellaceae bacterium 24-137]
MLAAFLVTLPVYAPNHLLFETSVYDTAAYMAPFANMLLGTSVVAGLAAAWASARPGGAARLLGRGWVFAGSGCYLAGYVLFILAAAVPGFGAAAEAVAAGALLGLGTVELAVCWGAYMAQYDLRQALLWVAVMVGLSALLEMLLASVTFAVGLLVFCVLLPLGCFLPCWKAQRGRLADRFASEGARDGAPLTVRRGLAAMMRLLAMPFAGLMVFAFLMGARKFILFDVVHMEVLGCVLGALVVVPLCFVRSSRPLLPVIYRLVLPAFALALIFLNSFPGGSVPLWFAAWLSYAFFGMLAILALASLAALAHGGELPCGFIFGVAVAAFAAFSILGVAAAATPPFQEQEGGPALLVVSTLFFVALIGEALVSLWRASRGAGDVPATDEGDELPGRPVAVPQPLDVAARCDALADDASLTPREREILGYLGRGHGIAFIAGTLVISESTVRTHVKAIYRKVGVGSREELLARVDEG